MPSRQQVIDKISNYRNDRRDRAAVLCLLKEFGWSLRFAPIMFRCDRECVEWALKVHGRALEFAHPDLRDTEEVVTLAVEQDGMALPWASERLRNNKQVVLKAVTNAGAALEFASDKLRANKDIVVAAATNDPLSMLAVNEKLKENKKFVIHLVQHSRGALMHVSKELREDPDVIAAAFSRRHRTSFSPRSKTPLRSPSVSSRKLSPPRCGCDDNDEHCQFRKSPSTPALGGGGGGGSGYGMLTMKKTSGSRASPVLRKRPVRRKALGPPLGIQVTSANVDGNGAASQATKSNAHGSSVSTSSLPVLPRVAGVA